MISPLVQNAPNDVIRSVVSTTVLLTWVEYGPRPEAPPLEFLRKWNSVTFMIEEEKRKKAGVDESAEQRQAKEWGKLLESYGWVSFDETDAAIAELIARGYIFGSGIENNIDTLRRNVEASEAEEEFVKGWRLYHDSLDDNAAEIVDIFDRTFDRAAQRITSNNLDATVCLLRDLGFGDLADSLINRYIQIRANDVAVFDPDESGIGAPLRDAQLKERFRAHYERVHHPPGLEPSLASIARGRGWSQEEIAALSRASVDELYRIFKSAGKRMDSMAKRCLEFEGDAQYAHIAERAGRALARIAGESRINRRRISQKFGIEPDLAEGTRGL